MLSPARHAPLLSLCREERMAQLQAVRPALVIDDDGHATITLTHEQLLLLETFVAQPKWRRAAKDTAAMFRRLGL